MWHIRTQLYLLHKVDKMFKAFYFFKACKSVSTHKKIACIKYYRTCFFNAHNGKNLYKVLASDSLWKLSKGFGNRSPRLNKAQHFDSVILNSSQTFFDKINVNSQEVCELRNYLKSKNVLSS